MATLKQATGALFTTVVASTNALSNTISAAASSADLLTNYVSKHKQEQALRYKVEASEFASILAEEASVAKVKRELTLKEFADASDFHAERLTQNLEYFTQLLAK